MAAGAAALYGWRVEPHWVEETSVRMPLFELPDAWAGKRAVQISDLHVGPVVSRAYLSRALQRVRRLRADLVFVTGDWMTCESTEQVGATIDLLRGAGLPGPVFGSLGNHDYGGGFRRIDVADQLTSGLQSVGVEVLRNGHVELDGLQVAGLDDLWARRCRVAETIRRIDPYAAAVVMCHNPDGIDLPGWAGFRGWVLAGHTHGGQCRLPGIGAPVMPVRNRRYRAGAYDLGAGRRLYVNRAVGYTQRVRFLARPEITVFELCRMTAAEARNAFG